MYVFANPNPHKLITDDCVIRAIALAEGRQWEDVYIDLFVEGYMEKELPNANGVWGQYLTDKGYERHIIPDTCPHCYSVKQFCIDNPHGTYVLGTGSHGMDFPWLMNGQQGINNNVSDGFRDAQLHDSITSVRDGISNLSTQLCGYCGDMQMALANGFSGVEQGANARQIANMQTAFSQQMATAQGFSNLASQLAECCCDQRMGIANLNSTIISENCADRQAINDGVRDIIASQTAGTQRILDQLCADKIDAKNEKIADLERQLTMANLQASQIRQTAEIQRGQVAEVDALYQRLKDCPVPTQPVYGSQPIFTCPNNNSGCGCSGNAFYN